MVKKRIDFRGWIKVIIIAVIVVTVIHQFLFAPIIVEGDSMMPTLRENDRMFVNKLSYIIGDPKRFDIIVFRAPEGTDYIKRVIGLPGDHIEYKDDTLYVNGKAYSESYLDEYKAQLIDSGSLTESFTLEDVINRKTVPEKHLFVMGDNRRNSKDSRHIGVISYDKVLGKTNFIYWPVKDIHRVE